MPPAPAVMRRPALASLARRAVAASTPAARGLALPRLAVPVVVEREPAAAPSAAAPSWSGLAVLAAAREAASHARFGLGFAELAHALHGAPLGGALLGKTPLGGAPPAGRRSVGRRSVGRRSAGRCRGWAPPAGSGPGSREA